MKIGDIVQVRFTKVGPMGSETRAGIIVGPAIKRTHAGYTWEILIDGEVHIILREHIVDVINPKEE